ncbi:MAG: hypothetical protein HZB68_04930 [Candidatus Aenigmarchaeota archaeon]|nr:hypothetical protein [Candidatus Aenigmarchaeota archaeon]
MGPFDEAYEDFLANKREAKRYQISDYFITLIRGESSVEIHKHKDGFKCVLSRDFENDRELIMITFDHGFHEMFSFGEHHGEREFRNDDGDSILLMGNKMRATLDKKYGSLIGKILDYYELVEK